ncbi:MAG: hypothetical protein GQ553_03840 [Nitrosomonadaceae bacterium]|nr:hypothetical protein [Nitrosomonadaceae bacterium]
MQQLIDTISGHLDELEELINQTDPNQFEAFEAEEFCKITGELITIMEGNHQEMIQLFGDTFDRDLLRLKGGAVAVYQSIPHLDRVDEILGSFSDEITESVHSFLDSLANIDEQGGGNV